ncbi:hypothetical protein GOP47_0007571 [Adiantum capillus-veneris]|uniref:Uncharacterized protein n=1 Tax=Adiantum capillus-veneris TaxID=13818 RepID=A0A9D4V1T2_ADICA|nr:hypothetical protein GOP47_0007571 [Adiantum capillus-veneris]
MAGQARHPLFGAKQGNGGKGGPFLDRRPRFIGWCGSLPSFLRKEHMPPPKLKVYGEGKVVEALHDLHACTSRGSLGEKSKVEEEKEPVEGHGKALVRGTKRCKRS